MTGFTRVALFAGLLALVFAGAALAGSALDPELDGEKDSDREAGSTHPSADESAHAADSPVGAQDAQSVSPEAPAKGLAQADGGLRLVLDDASRTVGSRRLGFRIVDEEGATVRDFDVEHARRMHLIVVRRDLSGFQHLHPEQTADGGWQIELRLPDPGSYRVFADFSSGGESHTLGTDLHAGGRFEARELSRPATVATTDSGHEVRLHEAGDEVRFTVFKDGRRIRDIEPYLDARGHLVALREGDLAYLHVHPQSEASEGSDIRFAVEYPSPGRYRLFLQFKLDGRVHTAAFTREVGEKLGP